MTGLLVDATSLVARLDTDLKKAKEVQRRLEQEDLPELMREFDLSEIKLADGAAVKVVDDLDCSITEERRVTAHAWLEEHGFGGLIKTAVTVDFGREEREKAAACAAQIQETVGRPAQLGERVHPATLKAFLKERLAAGAGVPFELFGVRAYARAKITAPRAK